MKLALALSERTDFQRRINEIGERLVKNAKVQEGEEPSEDPVALIEEMEKCYDKPEDLIARINHTNNMTKFEDITLTDMLAIRECLKGRVNKLRHFVSEASDLVGRYYLGGVICSFTV